MDARAHKRAACAALGVAARTAVAGIVQGMGQYPSGDDRGRALVAYGELAEELERRGVVVHRAPDPTDDAPALPYPDQIERVEVDQASAPENG